MGAGQLIIDGSEGLMFFNLQRFALAPDFIQLLADCLDGTLAVKAWLNSLYHVWLSDTQT